MLKQKAIYPFHATKVLSFLDIVHVFLKKKQALQRVISPVIKTRKNKRKALQRISKKIVEISFAMPSKRNHPNPISFRRVFLM